MMTTLPHRPRRALPSWSGCAAAAAGWTCQGAQPCAVGGAALSGPLQCAVAFTRCHGALSRLHQGHGVANRDGVGEEGLLRKQVDPKDSPRCVSCYLTEAGRACWPTMTSMLCRPILPNCPTRPAAALTGRWKPCWNRRGCAKVNRVLAPASAAAITAKPSSGLAAHCMKVNAAVSSDETALICVEHVRALNQALAVPSLMMTARQVLTSTTKPERQRHSGAIIELPDHCAQRGPDHHLQEALR